MKAIILAAGYATRLYPLTKNMPKALLPIAGRPMLDWFYENLVQTGRFDGVYVVSNHRYYEPFCLWAQKAREQWPDMPLEVLDDGTKDETERLGAVGDVRFAIEKAGIDDDVMVAASDNFITFSLEGFLAEFERTGRDTLLAWHMLDYEDRKNMAIATLDETGRVTRLHEKPDEPETDIAIFAIYLYRRDTLPLIGRFLDEGNNGDSPGRFPAWLYTRKDMQVWFYPGECVDIGTKTHLEAVRERFPDEQSVRDVMVRYSPHRPPKRSI